MNIERLFEGIRTIYESQKQDGWIYSPNLYIYGKSIEACVILQDIENLGEVTYIEEKNQLIDDYKQVGIEIKAFKFKKKAEYKFKEKDNVYIGYQVFMNEEQPIFDISQRSKLMSHKAYFDSIYLRGVKIISEDESKANYFNDFIDIQDTFEIKSSLFEMKSISGIFADMDPNTLTIDGCTIHSEELQLAFKNCSATYINITNNIFIGEGKIYGMFSTCQNLIELNLTGSKFPKIYEATNLFCDCIMLLEIKGLECFDMTQCKSAAYAFSNCKRLATIDIGSWELNSLEYADNMFERAISLYDLYIGKIETSDDLSMKNIFKDTNTQVKIHMKEKINTLDSHIKKANMNIAPIKVVTPDDYSPSHLRMLYKQFNIADIQDIKKYRRIIDIINTFESYIGANLITRRIRLDNDYYKLILNYGKSHDINGEAFEIDYQTYRDSDDEFIKNYMAKKEIFGSSEVIFDIGVCYLVYTLDSNKPLIYIREQ